jgi:ArsR family transcriptional regulator
VSEITKSALLEASAQVAKALGHPHRLHLLELLAQKQRPVEELTQLSGLTFANCSQHLQQLRRAGLVNTKRQGKHVIYTLMDDEIVKIMPALHRIAELNVAKIDRVKQDYIKARETMDIIQRQELVERMVNGEIVLVDLRPADEYLSGHIKGAINVSLSDLNNKLKTLPPEREVIAYCRGPYCVLSHQAVEELRRQGFTSRRLEGGYPEWKSEGLSVVEQ